MIISNCLTLWLLIGDRDCRRNPGRSPCKLSNWWKSWSDGRHRVRAIRVRAVQPANAAASPLPWTSVYRECQVWRTSILTNTTSGPFGALHCRNIDYRPCLGRNAAGSWAAERPDERQLRCRSGRERPDRCTGSSIPVWRKQLWRYAGYPPASSRNLSCPDRCTAAVWRGDRSTFEWLAELVDIPPSRIYTPPPPHQRIGYLSKIQINFF